MGFLINYLGWAEVSTKDTYFLRENVFSELPDLFLEARKGEQEKDETDWVQNKGGQHILSSVFIRRMEQNLEVECVGNTL